MQESTHHGFGVGGWPEAARSVRGEGQARMAKRGSKPRQRAALQITLGRAARLHRLVTTLGAGERSREDLLRVLEVGLRTFYRELELLRRIGVKIKLEGRRYMLVGPLAEAEGRLPCPNPHLRFAELTELASGPGPGAQHLAELRSSLIALSAAGGARSKRPSRSKRSS